MLVDFDGSSGDLHQLAQTFAHAVRLPQPGTRTIASPPPGNGALPPVQQRPTEESNGLFDDLPDPDIIETTVEEGAPADKPANGTKRKKLRTPVVVSTLDLTKGPVSFDDFIKDQDPKKHSKRYLAITQWLKQYGGLAEIGADHVYTCYRHLGLNVPKDVLSIFRGLKTQGWVEEGSEPGLFKITHVGENHLLKSKGKE